LGVERRSGGTCAACFGGCIVFGSGVKVEFAYLREWGGGLQVDRRGDYGFGFRLFDSRINLQWRNPVSGIW